MANQIPIDFVRRADLHARSSNRPLLEYRLEEADYHTVIEARHETDGYMLALPDLDVPFSTWREYMEHQGWDEAEMLEWAVDEAGFEAPEDDEEEDSDPDEVFQEWLDEDIPNPYDYVPHLETDTGAVYALLDDLQVEQDFVALGENDEALAIGRLDFVEGEAPGNDLTFVMATTAVALSCLQYVLDEQKAGLQIIA